MPRVLIGLGSNLGDRRHTLDAAVAAIAALPGSRIAARSSWYETQAVGGPVQGAFLNGVVLVETSDPAEKFLDELLAIEGALGRERTTTWGPRTIDLDLLLYDDAVIRTDRLRVPHPRLAFRKFVLRGATEVAATWRHPLLGRPLGDLAQHLETAPNYVAAVGMSTGFRTQFVGEAADAAQARLVDATPAGFAATVEEVGSHGLNLSAAIEFLDARREAIRRSFAEADGRWIVDDAWLAAEESELTRRLDDEADRRSLAAACRASNVDLGPKLLICLGTKTTGPHAAVLAVKHELAANAFGRDVVLPPIVDVDIGDREAALMEIAAALEAAGGGV